MTLDELSARTADLPRPRVLLLSAVEPPVSAGRLAALIGPAGGSAAPWDAADDPQPLEMARIVDFAPEVLVVLTDDLDAAEEALEAAEALHTLPCAAAGDCYVARAATVADEPRVLATILHPDVFTDLVPPFTVRIVNLA